MLACHHAEVGDPMTEVLEARRAYEDARGEAKEIVDRARARLGLSIREARAAGKSQTSAMVALNLSREQVRAFEKAYREWQREHPGEQLA
jgi:hypothetical protein